jgi:aminopeptidase N
MGLLWTEQQQGREAAVAQLNDLLQPVTLAEPALTATDTTTNGQPLISASDDLFYRRKAAAVWWMLRSIAGDEPFIAALDQWLTQPISHDSPSQQASAFEHLLEKTSNKDLTWFFADWVLRDRGLPDLTIAAVEPRQLPAGAGHNSGWLVAVTLRNDGAAAAEVPLTIYSGAFNTTKRLRIPGFSTITDRIVVTAPPTQVTLNDGTTPEVRTSLHTESIIIPNQN